MAAHRLHHAHADHDGDPHSPRDGFWSAQVLWLLRPHSEFDDPAPTSAAYVPDLAADPVHRFLERFEMLLQLGLAGLLYVLGEWWGGVGASWVVWGMAVRISLAYHVTALVNSATHRWGYRTYALRDDSTNLWWVAWLTGGEGWHNNHHAFPVQPATVYFGGSSTRRTRSSVCWAWSDLRQRSTCRPRLRRERHPPEFSPNTNGATTDYVRGEV